MKFLITEHKAVKAAIEKHGLAYDDFSFVKRRGLMYIFYGNEDAAFTFFRRKETRLNDQGQWEKVTLYAQNKPSKKGPVMSWEALMALFDQWLIQLKAK